MPELPEVETVVRSIKPQIVDKKIMSLHVFWTNTLSTHSPLKINKLLKNKLITSVSRRGKYIIIHLEKNFIVIHLRMTGKLIYQKNIKELHTHSRAEFIFNDRSKLIFTDIRKFGRIGMYKNLDYLDQKLGLEPFSKELDVNYLFYKLQKRTGPIKGALLNQSIVTGIGNIYADEILFKIKIHPKISSNKLKKKKLLELISAIKIILSDAIDSMGTTIINFSFDKESQGKYGKKLKVFRRENKPCIICTTKIIKIKCVGRGTYFCPNCQKNN
ncbi:MAG: DNA-formamidopyrimidine glycosylase [Candidatus Neomarinimicrobiota bacterium]|nr:DNA-formamidopyrimidine glycosylase [Candidatus Neomarinimicrobiota bacterium]